MLVYYLLFQSYNKYVSMKEKKSNVRI